MSQADTPTESPSPLRDFLVVLGFRKWTVLVITAIAVGAALGVSYQQTPTYESETQVLVKAVVLPSGGAPVSEPDLATEQVLAGSDSVTELAAAELGPGVASAELKDHLMVDVVSETKILLFRYTDPEPVEAQRRSAALAQAYLDFRREQTLADLRASTDALRVELADLNRQLEGIGQRIDRARSPAERSALQARHNVLIGQIALLQLRITDATAPRALQVGEIVERPLVAARPSSPNYLLNGLLALLAGLTLGVGAALLRERLDDRLRGREDLEVQTGAPVLAVIPHIESWRKRKATPVITLSEPRSSAAESYRTLRTATLFAVSQDAVKTVLVTSPHAGEGKTAVTANLGVALAQAGRRVLLVSGDFRRPRLHRFFAITNEPGLTDVLEGRAELTDAMVGTSVENLRVLPSGAIPAQPAELLGSERMGRVIATVREMADFVVVDGTPTLAISDAVTLAPFVDAVLFVADAGRTTRSAAAHARRQLEQVDANLVGAVLNNFDPSKGHSYESYYRYYYRYEPRNRAAPADSPRVEGGS
jgi:polysaccharide biosynthesis transport protein